ncbi:MAG: helicase-exonuclease AddAB subunit AddA [Eubacterium sp.]|nr:helicase-exonuclease AddAB subunit AddA [Eubacterium sp.]
MQWNEKQYSAIVDGGKNILVAAAAGSGKTAVLVERIRRIVCEQRVPVRNLLVVTFTSAAAAEMKEKIRDSLTREAERLADAAPAEAAYLRKQLTELPRTDISTFHSFALSVIRRFFYLTDLEPGFSTCDEARSVLMKQDAMDALLEAEFAEEREDFLAFMDRYSDDRRPDRVRDILLTGYERIMAMPHPWEWLDRQEEFFTADPGSFGGTKLWESMRQELLQGVETAEQYMAAAIRLLEENGLDRLADKVRAQEFAPIRGGAAFLAETGDLAPAEVLAGLSARLQLGDLKLSANKEEKGAYTGIKDTVRGCREAAKKCLNALRKDYLDRDLAEQLEDMGRTLPAYKTFCRLLRAFDQLYKEEKSAARVIDFADYEHYCLSILEREEAAEHYRKRFSHIFIDEYQDTNILQETIVSLIARPNNRFMVGDVKQSIYRFRLADPDIFLEKYRQFSGGDEASEVIDLNVNYRSKKPVIDRINGVFAELMTDYDDRAALHLGLPEEASPDVAPAFHVILEATEEADEEIAELKNTEIEALHCVEIIQKSIGKCFIDSKQKGKERPLRAGDIVILMRSARGHAPIFYRTLQKAGIESFIDDNDGYFDTMEIEVFLHLLSVIDNGHRDIPLISVLHSEIFGFSAEALGRIRALTKEGSFADALERYAGEEAAGQDPALKEKAAEALATLERWREMARVMPLSGFLWRLLLDSGYYIVMGAMPQGAQRQANLRALVDRAEKFSEDRQSSLFGFIRYVDALRRRKVPTPEVKLVGENDDLVRIMTIHKSKGLEFPMVIVAGMGRGLQYSKGGSLAIHKDVGVGLSLIEPKEHWKRKTLPQRIIAARIQEEEVEEQIRILYVAMTRARDFLYLTGTAKSEEKLAEYQNRAVPGAGSYLEMLAPFLPVDLFSADGLDLSGMTRRRASEEIRYSGVLTGEAEREILRQLEYRYPYDRARALRSKYSVSELNAAAGHGGRKRKIQLDRPAFAGEEERISAARKGTAYHAVMEQLDFVRAAAEGLPYIEAKAAELLERGVLEEKELKAIDLGRVSEFFASPIGKRAALADQRGELEKERAFTLAMETEGEEVLVQGIIDCYFREDGKTVLIDYKSNYINEDKGEEEDRRLLGLYREQLRIYRDALEEAGLGPVTEVYLYLLMVNRILEVKE